MIHLEPQSVLLASGVLYVAMPVTVWSILYRRHARPQLELWFLSGLLFSASVLLAGLRGQIPDAVGVLTANVMLHVALALMVGVLRLEAGVPAHWPVLAAAVALVDCTQTLVMLAESPWRSTVNFAGTGALAAAIAWSARDLARLRASRSATLMALLFGLLSLAALTRMLRQLLGWSDTDSLSDDADFIVALLAAFFAMVTANIGFLGLALDRARQAAREHDEALAVLRERQQAMEAVSRTREALAGERARNARLLAHEVRQPLHNAAVALQSGIATLAHSRDAGEAARAIEQAQSVIRRVSATLDNAVAATTMLAAQDRISTADTELQVLIDLCLGDLPPEARARVRIDYRADARSARLEPSLVRLALRNLLMNATLYAPPETPVILRVLDSDEPLALVLEVADLGPGIDESLRGSLFDEGARGAQARVPGYGLGLHVVQRVAQLHGGSVDWRPNEPRGSVFRLLLPQGDPG